MEHPENTINCFHKEFSFKEVPLWGLRLIHNKKGIVEDVESAMNQILISALEGWTERSKLYSDSTEEKQMPGESDVIFQEM